MSLSDKAAAERSRILQALLSGDSGTNVSLLPNVAAMPDATVEDGSVYGERVCEEGGGGHTTLLPVLISRTERSSGTMGRYYFLILGHVLHIYLCLCVLLADRVTRPGYVLCVVVICRGCSRDGSCDFRRQCRICT